MTNKSIGFITYFTSDFLELGIVSIRRFIQYHPQSAGIIFCFDDYSRDALSVALSSSNLEVINILSFHKWTDHFNRLSRDRNELEVITSLKPLLIIEAQRKLSDCQYIVYFDPDVMFFSAMDFECTQIRDFHVFEQVGIPHTSKELHGQYNAGLVITRSSEEALRLLKAWSSLCMEWCKLETEQNRYADQKYLDYFIGDPAFSAMRSLENNLSARAFYTANRRIKISKDGEMVKVENSDLVSFHFHGLRVLGQEVLTGINRFGPLHYKLRLFKLIYFPILMELLSVKRHNSKTFGNLVSVKRSDKTLKYVERSSPLKAFIQVMRLTRIPWWLLKLILVGEHAKI